MEKDHNTSLVAAIKCCGEECFGSALGACNLKLIRVLILEKADPNKKDKYGDVPLAEAVKSGRKDVVEILLAANADANIHDRCDNNSLFYACLRNDIMNILIEAKADLNAKDRYGKSLLHKLALCDEKSVAAGLIVAKVLIKKRDIDINIQSLYGMTPLHEASHCGNVEIAKILIESNANINKKANSGETPLFLALAYVRENVVQELLASGADPFTGLTKIDQGFKESIIGRDKITFSCLMNNECATALDIGLFKFPDIEDKEWFHFIAESKNKRISAIGDAFENIHSFSNQSGNNFPAELSALIVFFESGV